MRRRPAWTFLLVGVGGGILGLVPWLVTGGRLPLQNVWEETPAVLPWVLLPFHPYYVTLLAALLLVGATAAGIAARALGARGASVWLTIVGVFVVHVIAVVQTTLAAGATLPETTEARIWLYGLAGGAVVSALVGVGVTALVARAPRAGAVIGLTIGAMAASSWIAALIAPPGAVQLEYPSLLVVVPWIGPVLVGVAIAWAGVNTVGRIVAAIAAVAMVWVVPALLTGMVNALGSRVYWSYPAELVDYAVGVFRAALFTPELALRPVIATVVVAAVGLIVRAVVARRRPAETDAGSTISA